MRKSLKIIQEKIYINKILKEIDEFLLFNNNFTIDTIFIWWWTPSYLSQEATIKLLSTINQKLSKFFSKNIEFTFEWNPESLDYNKLELLKKYWIGMEFVFEFKVLMIKYLKILTEFITKKLLLRVLIMQK